MHVRTRVFRVHKAGNHVDDYEDAAWPERPIDLDTGAFRCAIADGATEASFSALWARLLVRGFCKQDFPTSQGQWLEWLRPHARTWRSQVQSKPLPWYAEEKVRDGAFASLLGLTLWPSNPSGSGEGRGERWRAVAVGDSCLVHMRETEVCSVFPLSRSEEFNNSPLLISSNLARNGALDAAICMATGIWTEGDRFYLMTDALSCWFLARVEQGDAPWTAVEEIAEAGVDAFISWIDALRRDGALRNDDVTLLHLTVS